MCMQEQRAERDGEVNIGLVCWEKRRGEKRREEKRSKEKRRRGEIELWRAERMEEKGVQILRKRDAKGFWLRGN